MSDVIIFDRMQQRRGTLADLVTVNEVLRAGELCVEIDTGKFKIGDGATAWTSLAYQGIWTLADIRAALDLLGSTASGDLIYKGASGWTRLAKGSDGQFLTLASGLPTWGAGGGGGGSGNLTYIATATVAGSAATTLTMSGLDLASDGCYIMYATLKNATGSESHCSLYFNGDTTASNYYEQVISVVSTALVGARGNDAIIASMDASTSAFLEAVIKRDLDGYPRTQARNARGAITTPKLQMFTHFRNNTANVTSITLSATVSNSIAVGSKFEIYKVEP